MHELTIMKKNIFTVKVHDMIIPVHDSSDLKSFDCIFIVMDLVERDISQLFTSQRPVDFTEDHVICIFYNILCCLNFLETANILHRDLKPSNILVTNKCAIKLCDFGFARTIQSKQNVPNHNESSHQCQNQTHQTKSTELLTSEDNSCENPEIQNT